MSSDDVLNAAWECWLQVAWWLWGSWLEHVPSLQSRARLPKRLSSAPQTAWSSANQLAQLQASPEREWLKGKGGEQQDKAISCTRRAFDASLCLEHCSATEDLHSSVFRAALNTKIQSWLFTSDLLPNMQGTRNKLVLWKLAPRKGEEKGDAAAPCDSHARGAWRWPLLRRASIPREPGPRVDQQNCIIAGNPEN